jgi:hypothetical protein
MLRIEDGMETFCSAWLIAATASLKATPGARLKEIVTAGNWPSWFTARGAILFSKWATALSGTTLPVGE